jgi:hypothetical protein
VAFTNTVWAIDEVEMPGQLWRLMLQSSTRSATGIVDSTDLAVTAQSTPASSVAVAPGACVALGSESANQGSYYGYNVGSVNVAITPTGSSGGRHDLLVAQVKDSTFPGTPWQSTDPPWSLQVISGVAAGTTAVPAGITAVPLARIDIPASTSAITQAMITDLRQMLSPRQLRTVLAATPSSSGDSLAATSFATWPPAATWQLPIPSWAGLVTATAIVSGAKCSVGAVFGQIRWNIGGIVSVGAGYDLTVPSGANYDRFTAIDAHQAVIPANIRGTTVTAQLQGERSGGTTGIDLVADTYTSISLDVEFTEAP